jgi:methylated-DNA-protein-cysteine methyltransferase-like protein
MSAPERQASFADAVVAVVASIPPGEVLTYGEVAVEAGSAGAARSVGRVLADAAVPMPWWRVVTASGRLVPGNEVEHARRLRSEGIRMTRSGERVAMRTR